MYVSPLLALLYASKRTKHASFVRLEAYRIRKFVRLEAYRNANVRKGGEAQAKISGRVRIKSECEIRPSAPGPRAGKVTSSEDYEVHSIVE
jgi:hypothetical protein